jgi:hypothetical protein
MQNPGARLSPVLLVAAVALAAILAGCDTPFTVSNTTILVPIAGGEKVEVTFGRAGPVLVDKDGVRMEGAILDLSPDKKHVIYAFKFLVKNGVAPKRVTVTDLTDDPAELLIDDRDPHLQDRRWLAPRIPRDGHEPALAWLHTVDDSMRIYRLTVTLADGTVAVLDQPVSYPGFLKAAILKTIGVDQ